MKTPKYFLPLLDLGKYLRHPKVEFDKCIFITLASYIVVPTNIIRLKIALEIVRTLLVV